MLDDNTANTRPKDDNESYRTNGGELDQKYIVQWTSPDENKYFFKHRYVSASRSVPRRSKQFVRYRISRSLNFDVLNIQNSSSENSSIDGEKYLSRSAKIMRALNFSSSSYYGKAKIKRSLNFNLTPSPKTFSRTSSKSVRRASGLSFATSSPKLSKVLNYDDSPSSSANSSLVYAASDSIDENQNETPQQRVKARQSLSYSTPDSKFSKKSPDLSSFTPYLRSSRKKKVNNVIYIAATPNQQSAKCKSRLKYSDDVVVGTPRNLLLDFHSEETGRPTTPENVIRLVPESMSAIKRSHKKERSSRRSERSARDSMKRSANEEQPQDSKELVEVSPIAIASSQKNRRHSTSIGKLSKMGVNRKFSLSMHESVGDDNLSDTGSIFDYKEEQEQIFKQDAEASDLSLEYDDDLLEIEKHEISEEINDSLKLQLEESTPGTAENEEDRKTPFEEVADLKSPPVKIELSERTEANSGAVTPEPTRVVTGSSQPITPENRINYLQHVLQDSIKRSHKKIKEDRKKKLFSPKTLRYKAEAGGKAFESNLQNDEGQGNTENEAVNNLPNENEDSTESAQRACTPEKINSSRLLLSQFSSIKKSHKKDKHNKILSRFKKRQEYFNRDLEYPDKQGLADLGCEADNSKDKESPDVSFKDMNDGVTKLNDACLDKLSPSKRKKSSLDTSLDRNASSVSCDSEAQACDSEKEDFQIFTPLKRKKASSTPAGKGGYFCFYKLPSGKEDISEESLADSNLSRCLTPVASLRRSSTMPKSVPLERSYEKVEEDANRSAEIVAETPERNACGRSTPRNMSTAELYPNVDSIKKSHKKNKRGNRLRRRMNLEGNGGSHEQESATKKSVTRPLNSSNESFELCLLDDDVPMENVVSKSSNLNLDGNEEEEEESRGVERGEVVEQPNEEAPARTPPNCLKTKSYITRLQNTSIKRSHKKVRDKKKHEIQLDVRDLSDEGSIFGDEERLGSLELEESSPASGKPPSKSGTIDS